MNRKERHALKMLGKRIRQLREDQGLSQAQLAFEAEIPRFQVSRIERGEINTGILNLIAISKALDINVQELFS